MSSQIRYYQGSSQVSMFQNFSTMQVETIKVYKSDFNIDTLCRVLNDVFEVFC